MRRTTLLTIAVALLGCMGLDSDDMSSSTPGRAAHAATPPPHGLPAELRLTLHREQSQGAFTILLPAGWSVRGGMGPSGVPNSVIDLVETNIDFVVTRPDGRAWMQFFPKVLFTEPFHNPYLPVSVGQNYNGTYIQPWMSPSDYVSGLVLPTFRRDLSGVQVRSATPVGRYLGLVPDFPGLMERRSEVVVVQATAGGVPVEGRLYTVLARFGMGGITNWAQAATFGYFAPPAEMAQVAPVLEFCLNSFAFDPEWVARYVQASSDRAQQFTDLQRYVQGVDADIAAARDSTRSDIMWEEWKVLTDKVEMRDPATGDQVLFPAYDRAFSDGQGNYVLTNDHGSIDLAPEWREMQVHSRTQ